MTNEEAFQMIKKVADHLVVDVGIVNPKGGGLLRPPIMCSVQCAKLEVKPLNKLK